MGSLHHAQHRRTTRTSYLINNIIAIQYLLILISQFHQNSTLAYNLKPIVSNHDETTSSSSSADTPSPPSRRRRRRNLLEEWSERFFSKRLFTSIDTNDDNDDISNRPSASSYGVDVSFPIHSYSVSQNYEWLPHNINSENSDPVALPEDSVTNAPIQPLGNRQAFYDEFMEGCRQYYGGGTNRRDGRSRCNLAEKERIDLCLRQPPLMQNYTHKGFQKLHLPNHLFNPLSRFWKRNQHLQSIEKWRPGTTYTNHWSSPTYTLPLDDFADDDDDDDLATQLRLFLQTAFREWTSFPLPEMTTSGLYGIRVFTDGAVMSPHVDRRRLPFGNGGIGGGAVMNVAGDVEEDWVLEVYGHDDDDGRAYNVTMKPGDVVLYEGYSVIHGHPFPLKGNYIANIYIYFESNENHFFRHDDTITNDNPEDNYNRAFAHFSNQTNDGDEEEPFDKNDDDVQQLPAYIIKNTPEEKRWRQEHPEGKIRVSQSPQSHNIKPTTPTRRSSSSSSKHGATNAHIAADLGHLSYLKQIAVSSLASQTKLDHFFHLDDNGWMPLHEAARSGHLEVVKLLLEQEGGLDRVNVRTRFGEGGTATWLAEVKFGKEHPVVRFLKSVGGVSVAPEQRGGEEEEEGRNKREEEDEMKEKETEQYNGKDEHQSHNIKPITPTRRSSSSKHGASNAHIAADLGHLTYLKQVAESSLASQTKHDHFFHLDDNGWMPLHEAARSGHLEVVKFLLEQEGGLDRVNVRTHFGEGYTAMWLAEYKFGKEHPVVRYLESVGGVSSEPLSEEKEDEEKEEEKGEMKEKENDGDDEKTEKSGVEGIEQEK